MNIYLFHSSLGLGVINIIIALYYNVPRLLLINITFGVITSILNHGWTSNSYKYIDRLSMIICSHVDIYMIISRKNHIDYIPLILIILAIIFYLISKYLVSISHFSNYIHMLSHLSLTIAHIRLCQNHNIIQTVIA